MTELKALVLRANSRITAYSLSIIKAYFSSYSGLPKLCWQGIILGFIEATLSGVCLFLSIYFVDDLHFSISIAGVMISFYGLGRTVGGLLGGKLSDRISPGLVSIASLVIQAAAFLILIKLKTIYALMLNLFVLGVATYGFITSNNVWVLNHCKDQESIKLKTLSMLHAASNLGIGLSALLVSLLSRYGFSTIFLLSSVLLFVSAIYLVILEKSRVYVDAGVGESDQHFIAIHSHRVADIVSLTHRISSRIARYLERHGFIERDAENSFLAELNDSEARDDQSYSVNYRISIGHQKGRKVFALKTLPSLFAESPGDELVGKISGFSLHAGVLAKAHQRAKLERLCRYISRPPVSTHRLSLTSEGSIRYELKTPYRNGTTAMLFEPLDFISKLAALVPSPRVNLTRFYGVFAPNSRYRSGIIIQLKAKESIEKELPTASEKRGAMTWAARLKRAFEIDIKKCESCGGSVKIVACIDDPVAINKILSHLQLHPGNQHILPVGRAPPMCLQASYVE